MGTPKWVQELSQTELESRFWRTKMEPSPERLALLAEMTRRECLAKAWKAEMWVGGPQRRLPFDQNRVSPRQWWLDRSRWLPGFLMGSPL